MLNKVKSAFGGKNLAKIGLGLGLLATQVGLVFAADIEVTPPAVFTKVPTLGSLISGVVGIFIIAAALLSFIYLVWGGVQWISSGGDKAGIEAARNRLTAALIGLFIVAAAWAITVLIEKFFGITIISKPGITIPTGY